MVNQKQAFQNYECCNNNQESNLADYQQQDQECQFSFQSSEEEKITQTYMQPSQVFKKKQLKKSSVQKEFNVNEERINQNKLDMLDFRNKFSSNNLIKNILKQFKNFLTKKQNVEILSEFIMQKPVDYSKRLVNRFFNKLTYNNCQLIRIIEHKNYGRGFEYFLTFEAAYELHKSKVKNIQQHLHFISYLKECCVDKSLIKEINFYRK